MAHDLDALMTSAPLASIRAAVVDGVFTARDLTAWSLDRIECLSRSGPALNAVRSVADGALEAAAELDRMLATGVVPGLLFGIPVLVKDNIATTDGQRMAAGCAALADFVPGMEAHLVSRLRAAGAVVIGKTNLTELADYVSEVMPSEFSGAGGVVKNPHGSRYDRGGGSSVGSAAAVAAGLVPLAFGSETQNSIQTPACHSSLVGFKPSVGRVSRRGIVPLVPSQDSPGPLARTVADARLAIAAVAGADPADTATLAPELLHQPLTRGSAAPAQLRLGVPRIAMADRADMAPLAAVFDAVLSRLAEAGIDLVDPCDLPAAEQLRDARSCVFPTEFKAALNAFLSSNGAPCGIGALADLIAWNASHPEAIPFGQSLLLAAEQTNGLDDPRYVADRRRDLVLSRDAGIDAALRAGDVDALVFPMSVAAKCTGKAGAPVIAIPTGAGPDGTPFGITLTAAFGCDDQLLAIAERVEGIVGQRLVPGT